MTAVGQKPVGAEVGSDEVTQVSFCCERSTLEFNIMSSDILAICSRVSAITCILFDALISLDILFFVIPRVALGVLGVLVPWD